MIFWWTNRVHLMSRKQRASRSMGFSEQETSRKLIFIKWNQVVFLSIFTFLQNFLKLVLWMLRMILIVKEPISTIFWMQIVFGQKLPKPAIVSSSNMAHDHEIFRLDSGNVISESEKFDVNTGSKFQCLSCRTHRHHLADFPGN